MKSLIPLASAWGWYPDVDRAERLLFGCGLLIVVAVLAYFVAKAVWPKEKW
jgi:phage shock protein PspC (stress-responsive transcriptional regulator)